MILRTMIHLFVSRFQCRVFNPHSPQSRASFRRSLLGALGVGRVPRLRTPGASLHVACAGGSARHAQHHLAQVSWHRGGASASIATKWQRQCSRQDVAECRHVEPEVPRQRQCRQCEAVRCRQGAACVPGHCGDTSRQSMSAAKAAQGLRRPLLTVPADRQGRLCRPSICSLVKMLPVWETRRWKHQGANARAKLEAAAQRCQRAIDGARLPALRCRLGIDGIVAQMSVQLAKATSQQGADVSPRHRLAAAAKCRWLLHRKGDQPHRVVAMRTRMQKAETEAVHVPHKLSPPVPQTSWNSEPQRSQTQGSARRSGSLQKLERRGLPPPSEDAWMKF